MATSKGKGGNLVTQNNPFFNGPRRVERAPDFTEVPFIAKSMQICVQAGCAIMLGHTRDGGAVVLTVLDGDKRHRTYCSNVEELNDAFQALIDMYGED